MLGKTGLSVSAIGFGCGSTGGLFVRGSADEQRAALECAIEGGINYVDTAAQYGDGLSELNLGRAMRELAISPLIGTKLRIQSAEIGDAKQVLHRRIEESLNRLGIGRVDVCTLHTRIGSGPEDLRATDVMHVVAPAMRDLIGIGLVGAIGFTGLGDTEELLEVAASGVFDSFQCYYNLLNQSAHLPGSPDKKAQDFQGLLGLASGKGLGAIGIRILAGGALAGDQVRHKSAGPIGQPMVKGEEYSDDVARSHRYQKNLARLEVGSLPELAYRFALANQNLSCILGGFSDARHVQDALEFEKRGPLSERTLAELEELKL